MDRSIGYQFSRMCMIVYVDELDIGWFPDYEGDTDTEAYKCAHDVVPAIEKIRHQNRPHMDKHFADLLDEEELRFPRYIMRLASTMFETGHSSTNLIEFLSWTFDITFQFYSEGKENYPDIALEIVTDVVDFFIERKEFLGWDDLKKTAVMISSGKKVLPTKRLKV